MTTANPPFTGSYAVGLQGINVSRFDLFGVSIAPKMGMSGITTYLSGNNQIIDVSPDARDFFDDSLRLPKRIIATSGSSGDVSGSLVEVISDDNFRVQQVPRYHLSRQTFGIEKSDDPGVPFVEMNSFDPVVYLDNQNQVAWPLVFDVPNAIDPFDFDGAIEPFVLRKTIAGNSTFTGTPDDPEPTGIRGGVSSGQLFMNSTGRAVECSNFYIHEATNSEFFDEGMDLEAEDTALVAEILPATGSIMAAKTWAEIIADSDWSAGRSLTFSTAGATFSATIDTTITLVFSTATSIGVAGTASADELILSINNSLIQAIKYGVGSTSHDARTDTSANLDILLPTLSADGLTISMTSSLPYKNTQMEITGSLLGNALGTDTPRLAVRGMGGAVTDFYEIDIPAISDFIAPISGYLDREPVEELFSTVSSPEIRKMLIMSMSATGRNDLPTGYPGLNFRSKPCGFEYANSNGIDSIVYGGKLK